MDPHQAFLQPILEHPDDDLPRLVYADWLEEHGDPCGQFIRLQCAVAKMPRWPDPNWPKRQELEFRALRLLGEHDKEWLGSIRLMGVPAQFFYGHPDHRYIEWWYQPAPNCRADRILGEFHRGFIEWITAGTPMLLKYADELFRTVPVTTLHLGQTGPLVTALAELPYLATVSKLDLNENRIGDEGVGVLANSPHLGRLTDLCLRDVGLERSRGLSADSIAALLGSPNLPKLTRLCVAFNGLKEAVRTLAKLPCLARLTSLDLSGNGVDDAGVEGLAASPYVANLEELLLAANRITDAGCRALAASPFLAGLKELYLQTNEITDAGCRALASSPYLAGLTTLDLSYHRDISAAGREALEHSPYLKKLTGLKLVQLDDRDWLEDFTMT